MSSPAWEKCPVCRGSGKMLNAQKLLELNYSFEECTVCMGKKIISTVTGLPPGSKACGCS